MLTPYAHPETGEVLESLDDFRAALRAVDQRMSPLFHLRRSIREEMAERFETPPMPRRIGRTEKQERIATCPRCGLKMEETP